MNGRDTKVSCPIVQQPDGTHLTYITIDDVIVDKVPTPASQIRHSRESMLWKPAVSNALSGRMVGFSKTSSLFKD